MAQGLGARIDPDAGAAGGTHRLRAAQLRRVLPDSSIACSSKATRSLFRYDDTLIRLYPERLWSDAAILIGVLTGATAVGLLAAGRLVGETRAG